jgi:uncharacterized membrane protein YhaH (DUF805 family)
LSVANAILKGFLYFFRMAGRSPRRAFVPFAVLFLFLWVGFFFGQRMKQAWYTLYVFSFLNEADYEARLQIMLFFQRLSFFILPLLSALFFFALVRRLQDLGYSARWAVAMYLAPVLAFLIPLALAMASFVIWPNTGLSDDGRGIGSAIIGVYLFFASLAVNFLIVIILCFRPSQPGPNRYGPNPHEVFP